MIVGRIKGRITTKNFSFEVEENPKKFDYVQVFHKDYDYVLCQIVEIESNNGSTTAKCQVIGYKDDSGRVRQIRTPFEEGSEVLVAEDDFIREVIRLDNEDKSAYMGHLEGKNIPIYLKLNKLLTKHVAILAKSGAGKSYTVGVLLEEIIEKNVPLLVLDPHGEYGELRYPNELNEKMALFGIKPKGFGTRIVEYGDPDINPELKPLRLSNEINANELLHLLPTKLSTAQQNVLFSALKDMDTVNLMTLMQRLELEENNAKYSVINVIDYLDKLSIFSSHPTPYQELVRTGKCTIINLKGIEPMIQEIIAYKLLSDLFELRKKEVIAPFFTVIEEAHMFCPERSFGETKSSRILRTIASEGRKFGQGLCIVSQRPARVDKSVLSQCSTQIILKVSNPNDLKAISNSVEGITSESEKEIINLPVGTALITGVVDVPLFVNIRPRKSKHGGEAIDMLASTDSFLNQVDEFEKKEILPVIMPKVTKKDLMLMHDEPIKITTILRPCTMFICGGGYQLLIDLSDGTLVYGGNSFQIPELKSLSGKEISLLKEIFKLKKASVEELSGYDKEIKSLLDIGYIVFDKGFAINKSFIFTALEKKQSHEKIQFKSVSYNRILDKKFTIEEMKDKLSEYTEVKDSHECFIVEHNAVKAKEV